MRWILVFFLLKEVHGILLHQRDDSDITTLSLEGVALATSSGSIEKHWDVNSCMNSSDVGLESINENLLSGKRIVVNLIWLILLSHSFVSIYQANLVFGVLDILWLKSIVWFNSDNALKGNSLDDFVEV